MSFIQVNATAGTTGTKVYTLPTGVRQNVPVYIDNNDAAPIWIGNSAAVTTSGATVGIKIAAGGSRQLWMCANDTIYAVSAAGTAAGAVLISLSA